ncbi:MAG: hypothetical protein HZA08_00890 [Nitrospirae bacterium]|nr:hypothetical protein [Nitrospirota bacterium]
MKYAFDHTDVLDDIPADAELVILPTDDLLLYNENKTAVDSLLKEGKNQKQYCRILNYCQPK